MALPSTDEVLRKADELPAKPVAIEAFWDGDTTGWFLTLTAVCRKRLFSYTDFFLGTFRDDGGDMRLFHGQVPPWPEAVLVSDVGLQLAKKLGVPFYFPSPNYPEDQCPRWWERQKGYPCRVCGILLLQSDPCPWRGICYHCHLKEERERKEANWSPEERAGPRCEMCGNPTKPESDKAQLCRDCRTKYDEYSCSRCGCRVLILNTMDHTDICSGCDLRARLDSVAESDRQAVRDAATSRGHVFEAMKILGWEFHDALAAIREFTKTHGTDGQQ